MGSKGRGRAERGRRTRGAVQMCGADLGRARWRCRLWRCDVAAVPALVRPCMWRCLVRTPGADLDEFAGVAVLAGSRHAAPCFRRSPWSVFRIAMHAPRSITSPPCPLSCGRAWSPKGGGRARRRGPVRVVVQTRTDVAVGHDRCPGTSSGEIGPYILHPVLSIQVFGGATGDCLLCGEVMRAVR